MKYQPHILSAQDLIKHIEWKEYASASTADLTQRKRLSIQVGKAMYRVDRRYLADSFFGEWKTVLLTEDPKAAMKAYNDLG